VDCLSIRGRLAEFVLSGLGPDERPQVERHLDWCAGCRKEAGELAQATTVLAVSIEPVEPPAELEQRVVRAVTAMAGRRLPGRRRWAAAAMAAAAMVVVSALGSAAFLLGRAELLAAEKQTAEDRTSAAEAEAKALAEQVEQVLRSVGAGSEEAVRPVQLSPVAGGEGAGSALVYDSADRHWAMVAVAGLEREGLPYRVAMRTRTGSWIPMPAILDLDIAGAARSLYYFDRSLSGVSRIVVRDIVGHRVLVGTVDPAPTQP
jgi:anti-sigma factor RsiW